ncbi:nucleotidyl transferase AbiEii/AbiGii toxin family protein [Pararhizobium sp. O133]|uniref:nucleotidyl transferase AbiEii/AbiGii toxin family protein n=1 Tax=Pararhizobium sp. O133 TaxID=3449278 RepID=UPI003F687891
MNTLTPHIEILPERQRALWPLLKPAAALGFVLYGGTAVALRLGHRQSIDFDFFSEKSLDLNALYAQMPFLQGALVVQQSPDTLTVLVQGAGGTDAPVKVSFFGPIRTGRVGVPQFTHDGVLLIASPEDLFATNVNVLLQRVEAKDYHDIVSMLSAGQNLEKALGGARRMYGYAYQPSESLKAMTYFEGGDLRNVSQQERAVLIEAVKSVRTIPDVEILDHRLSIDG